MADRADGAHSRVPYRAKHLELQAVALGRDSLPSAAREFRCCRQPKRISIATLDYGGRLAPMHRAFWHMVAGAALPSYHFAERSTSERRLGAVSAENASSGLIRSRGRDRCTD